MGWKDQVEAVLIILALSAAYVQYQLDDYLWALANLMGAGIVVFVRYDRHKKEK